MKLLRLVATMVGLLVGAAILAAGLSGAQAGSAAPPHVISCQSMQSESNSVFAPIALSGCRRLRTTGGSGTTFATGLGPYPITWSTGKQTNFNARSASFPSPSRCAAPLMEFDFVGTIATVSGPWTKQFLGDAVAFDVCVTSGFVTIGLVPGTLFTIG